VRSGRLAARIERVVAALPYRLNVGSSAMRGVSAAASLEDAFIHLFDAPAAGQACPLYAGVYAHNRRDAMEEILRFYRHFGVTSAGSRDLPDSIPTMFEFLHLLAIAEEACTTAGQREALRMSQRDLLERHLQRWASNTRERIASRDPHPFYAAAIDLAAGAVEADTGFLVSITAEALHSPSR
jgi:DMSO reductase family type II enzyme chaperone